jgi:hypothetical protein
MNRSLAEIKAGPFVTLAIVKPVAVHIKANENKKASRIVKGNEQVAKEDRLPVNKSDTAVSDRLKEGLRKQQQGLSMKEGKDPLWEDRNKNRESFEREDKLKKAVTMLEKQEASQPTKQVCVVIGIGG